MIESEFKESSLRMEISQMKKEHINFYKTNVRIALEKQPNSKFWKEALEFLKKHKYYESNRKNSN
jgi:hypothetical protein